MVKHYFEDTDQSYSERIRLEEGDQLDISLGHFKVQKLLGNGGFGSVFLIKSTTSDEDLAIKVIYIDMVMPYDHARIKQRLWQEYKIGHIGSPYLVRSHSVGSIKGNPYVLMEYCSNGTILNDLEQFSLEQNIYKLVHEISLGLQILHSQGYVHRDIKPGNVFSGADGCFKIGDFGIAANLNKRMTKLDFFGNVKNNEMFGSPLYSSPEQLNKDSYYKYTRPTMDIYSLGVLLYFILTKGGDPFGGEELYKESEQTYLENKHNFSGVSDAVLPLGFSKNWLALIDKCLQPDPEYRYQTIEELLNDLPSKSSVKSKSKVLLPTLLVTNHMGEKLKLIKLGQNGLSGKSSVKVGRNSLQYKSNDIDVGSFSSQTMQISKKHFTLQLEESGWNLYDGQEVELDGINGWYNSLNGTFLNGQKLDGRKPYKLNNGDVIEFGTYKMIFSY